MTTIAATDRELPSLSLVILTWNRQVEIIETLKRLDQMLNHAAVEIVVVDNGSTDGTADAISTQFGHVTVVRRPTNEWTSAWNHGVQRACADLVVTLDDDSAPKSNWLGEIATLFAEDATLGAVACRVEAGPEHQLITRNWAPYTTSFIACGSVFRRDAFLKVGGYDAGIFLYSHERDLALRLLSVGYRIRYKNDWAVWHRKSPLNRSYRRFIDKGLEDSSYRIAKYYPAITVPLAISASVLFYTRRTQLQGGNILRHLPTALAALARGVRKGLLTRQPFSMPARLRVAKAWREEMQARGGAWCLATKILPRTFFF